MSMEVAPAPLLGQLRLVWCGTVLGEDVSIRELFSGPEQSVIPQQVQVNLHVHLHALLIEAHGTSTHLRPLQPTP